MEKFENKLAEVNKLINQGNFASSLNYLSELHEIDSNNEEVNFLTEIKLYEVSLVTVAANSEAMIESMKTDGQTNSDVVSDEFDRLIAIERNNEKK